MLKRAVKRTLLAPLVVEAGGRSRPLIALTFDDGPDPECTQRLLDVLERHAARATFFLIGERADDLPGIVDRIVAGGHEIGNHSYCHPDIATLGYQQLRDEIARGDRVLARDRWRKRFHGLFRPPCGQLTLRSLFYALFHRRRHILWSIDPRDYGAQSPEAIVEHIRGQGVRPGDILLLHDATDHTPEAVDMLLGEFAQQGLTTVTVSELLGRAPPGAAGAAEGPVTPGAESVS